MWGWGRGVRGVCVQVAAPAVTEGVMRRAYPEVRAIRFQITGRLREAAHRRHRGTGRR
jgi:hypothetical protein